jgi:hypothetical protein
MDQRRRRPEVARLARFLVLEGLDFEIENDLG